MMRLLVTAKGEGRTVESADAVALIGRGAECSVHIDDEAASHKHCRIEQGADGSFTVSDLGSRNGTRLNGDAIKTQALKVGDVILIGTTTIAVQALGSAEHPSTAPTEPLKPPPPEVLHPIRLDFLAGPNKGQSFAVTRKLTRIGRRRRDNDLALVETGISNRHAEIRCGADGFEIADVGSRNGTFVNNQRVTRSPIKPGDRIQLGRCLLEVRAMDATTEPTAQIPKPSPLELAPIEAEEPGTADVALDESGAALDEAEGGGEPVSPASRRRVVLLSTAIILAAVFFTGAYVVRAILKRSTGPTPSPTEPTEKPKEPAAPGKGGQPAETPKADTASPTGKGADAGGHEKAIAKAADPAAAAREQLQTALDALRRAEIAGEPEAFDAAERALTAAKAPLKGTAHEGDLSQALARLPVARQAAADRRLNAEAAALLAAAKQHSDRKEPHIARLHCRELLARFPASAAAAEAKAMLQALDAPPPIPKEK